jgi:tetratricopeptide (TPR) repeat protein
MPPFLFVQKCLACTIYRMQRVSLAIALLFLCGSAFGWQDESIEELFQAAETAFAAHNPSRTIDLALRVVTKKPKHPKAWFLLGRAYTSVGRYADAESALGEQIALDAFHESAYQQLAWVVFLGRGDKVETERLLQKQVDVNPLSDKAFSGLGDLYSEKESYEEAAKFYETAASIVPENLNYQGAWGRALFMLGRYEEGAEKLEKMIAANNEPAYLYFTAAVYAQKRQLLDKALGYAESACSTLAAELRAQTLTQSLSERGLFIYWHLRKCWDALGLVHDARDEPSAAEPFLRASFVWSGDVGRGKTLGDFYERQKRRTEAIQAYGAAVSSAPLNPRTKDSRLRLQALLKTDVKIKEAISNGQQSIQAARTIHIPIRVKTYMSAELYLLTNAEGDIEETRFISGDEALRSLLPVVQSKAKLLRLPGSWPTRVPVQGAISCSAVTRECTFVFYTADRIQQLR